MKRSLRGALLVGASAIALLPYAGAGLAANNMLSLPTVSVNGTNDADYGQPVAGDFSWPFLGQNADTGSEPGQDVSLGYDNTDFTLRGKWDNRNHTRGGMTFGATLDEARRNAIGGGFLTNERASEFYGQYQFIAPSLDPLSAFTLGEYVSRENQFYSTGDAQVWGYTTYLNWFKRNDSRQQVKIGVPSTVRNALKTIMDNTSALSGTLAHTYAPKVQQGDEGSPRTHAVDLSMRAVSPAVLGRFFPVSAGVGANYAHYDHVDNTTQNRVIGNGGLGVAFLGSDYFDHLGRFKTSVPWLVGFGTDADTRGVVGGTAAAEVGPVSISYRQSSDHQQQVLVAWRVSDLFSDRDRQHASTLAVSDGGAPLSFSSLDAGASLPDSIARAESGLTRMGFMPPTGAEVNRGSRNEPGAAPTMRLSPNSAALQPQQVQAAIKRTQDLNREVTSDKNTEVQKKRASTNTDTTAPTKVSENFPGLTTQGAGFGGTITFNEPIAAVTSVAFTGGGGAISVFGGIGTNTVTFTGTAPNYDPASITVVVRDAAGNSSTIVSNSYALFP